MKSAWKIMAQIIFFIFISYIMNQLVAWLHLPIPSSILGMIVVFLLLQTKMLRREWLEAGSSWLIAELLLFFISPAVGIISYRSLLMSDGLQIVLVVALGTVVVMVCSGLVAQLIARRKERARP
ncbi:CidA/LrgA family holin-like protein [Paenibacillus doosanensis]|uniref:CidA/LrgA family protein n=1 Tax=Paenibacillus doosanensis TaxID=1229154 RepID=UPI00217F4E87|nr:CidA/LrgA family holin-like protein [Paenibacillus doosanensis]MCS7459608.1 CidA/LrgA family holin-like protein [Paenibacillus doosanensis]